MSDEKDLYFVAVKLFLRAQHKLLITHDVWGDWDLVGGRLLKSEFDTPLDEVVARKVKEELGEEVKYKLGAPVIFFRHQRQEAGLGNKQVRIFAIGYEAEYLGGEIKLWQHHDEMKWVDIHTFLPQEYFTGGWLTGVMDYVKLNSNSSKDRGEL